MPISVRCPDDSSVPIAFGEVRDPEAFEAFLDARLGIGESVELAVETQILVHAHAFGERQVARREPDALRGLTAVVREIEAAHTDRAAVGRHDAENHEQRRGLARAVGAEQRDALPRVNGYVDTVDRARPAVVLDEAARLQHHFARHAPNGSFFTWSAPTVISPTVIAVDWSGAKRTGLSSGIWLAVIEQGRLVRSEALSMREHAVEIVEAYAPPVIAGFDFSFGFPAWFAHRTRLRHDRRRLVDGRARRRDVVGVATDSRRSGETGATFPSSSASGGARKRCAKTDSRRSRSSNSSGTDRWAPDQSAGCPTSTRLRGAGFAIWPFDQPADRIAMEIYPSLMRKRAAHHDVGPFANEHERDAVVSARVLWDHRETVAALEAATDPVTLIEGDVWTPPAGA